MMSSMLPAMLPYHKRPDGGTNKVKNWSLVEVMIVTILLQPTTKPFLFDCCFLLRKQNSLAMFYGVFNIKSFGQ